MTDDAAGDARTGERASTQRPNAPAGGAVSLSSELRGELPCVVCGYNLRGLTVRGVCPECATSIRTTLLAVVDPLAKELRPIRWRHAVAAGMVLWSMAALASAACVWAIRIADVFQAGSTGADLRWARLGAVVFAALSGVGALALIRPHAAIPARHRSLAVIGVLAYLPLVFVMYRVHLVADWRAPAPYVRENVIEPARTMLRLVGSGAIALILMGLRPNARLLQARWLLMRIGSVGRQTMLTLVAVVVLWSVGDVLTLLSHTYYGGADALLRSAGWALILVGSVLFTAGLAGAVLDCVRVGGVILRPARTLEQVVSGE